MTPWSFVHVTDIHVGTPRSFRFRPAWNENWQTARAQIVALEPEFLLLGGDMTRDGCTHRFELEQIKQDLDALPFPWHAIPGNHEVGNKFTHDSPAAISDEHLALYHSVFGESQWSFVHGDVRFSAFDAFLAGSGLAGEVAMWDWLERQAEQPLAKWHVWLMHPAPFIDDPAEPNWDRETDRNAWYFCVDTPHRDRMMKVFRDTHADVVISGHIHCRHRAKTMGINFQYAPATAFSAWGDRWPDGDDTLGFLHGHVSDAGVELEFVPLLRPSRRQDSYGPGGSPSLDIRDYALAWEQPALNPDEQRFPGPA